MRRATVLASRVLAQGSSLPAVGPCSGASSFVIPPFAAQQASISGARAFSLWGSRKQEEDAPVEQVAEPPVEAVVPAPEPALDPETLVQAAALSDAAALTQAVDGVWAPIRPVAWLVQSIHESLGGPWWQTILVATVAQRAVLVPVTIFQTIHSHRLHQAKPDIMAMQALVAEETARGIQTPPMQQAQRIQNVYKAHGTGPLKVIAGMAAQMPIAIGAFTTLRHLAAANVPSYVEGGVLWFPDLSQPDPYFVLPFLISASFATALKFGMDGVPRQVGEGWVGWGLGAQGGWKCLSGFLLLDFAADQYGFQSRPHAWAAMYCHEPHLHPSLSRTLIAHSCRTRASRARRCGPS